MSSPAAKTIRSNSGNIHSGNHDGVVQPAPKNKHSAEAIKKSENQSLARPKQVWRKKNEKEPLNDRSKQSNTLSEPVKQDQFAENKNFAEAVRKSGNQKQARKKGGNQTQTVKKNGNQRPQASKQVSGVQGNIEPEKDSSKSSSNMSLSKRVEPGQPAQTKNSAEAVKQSGKQKPQPVLGVQEKAEPLKDSSKSSTKKSLSEGAVKKNGSQTPRSPKRVSGIKKKTETSKDSSRLSSRTSSSRRHWQQDNHHIEWDDADFVKSAGENCFLCEIDLACSPVPTEEEEEEEFESYKLPDIAVLACGHVFHVQCLQFVIPEEQSKDPSCFICASLY